jgi:hypothetical protein
MKALLLAAPLQVPFLAFKFAIEKLQERSAS